ncbi:hypothetical protein C440_12504 [Haloferax mucosum ATCC BAA-1512]|uniref:SHOCT domain-containing protein n=1 Tax=Haloferax mucosum ATCC BAA-1512 TaxID=662479 RepID=M0I7Z3_9EURY|nr:SHOCT domain-containing protein [Haloferax mucosum]ELZ92940.1 hypothetical protein C440_12504 [Haloferax mucosum ATCC BAA-1512]
MTTTNSTRLAGIVLLAVAALFVFPVLLGMSGFFGAGPMGWGGGWMHDTWMHGGGGGSAVPWWMWGTGLVGQLLLIAVLVGGGVLLFRAVGGDGTRGDEALAELRSAYARGDIDDEEFDRRRERLERD